MSRRENKKLSHAKEEQFIRELLQEKEILRKAKWALGYRKLEKPIFNGYVKYLYPREDLLRGKDEKYYLELVDITQDFIYSRDKLFMQYNPNMKKDIEAHCFPRSIHAKKYESLSRHMQKEFEPVVKIKYMWGSFAISTVRYEVKYPWKFVEKVKKHYKTKVKIIDSDIERRLDEINELITSRDLWEKASRIMGWGYKDSWDYADNEKRRTRISRLLDSEMEKEREDYFKGGI